MIVVDEQVIAATGLEPRQQLVADANAHADTVGRAEVVARAELGLDIHVQALLDLVRGPCTQDESRIIGPQLLRQQGGTQQQQGER